MSGRGNAPGQWETFPDQENTFICQHEYQCLYFEITGLFLLPSLVAHPL